LAAPGARGAIAARPDTDAQAIGESDLLIELLLDFAASERRRGTAAKEMRPGEACAHRLAINEA
jgi:hypothetical protein